mmetsp:Transcript_9837/g.35087  ORF Transcript_9837/g.35087 Transcript_9837/m.35087 type:complete len:525 (-) Transcript_9837:69-1643(-)
MLPPNDLRHDSHHGRRDRRHERRAEVADSAEGSAAGSLAPGSHPLQARSLVARPREEYRGRSRQAVRQRQVVPLLLDSPHDPRTRRGGRQPPGDPCSPSNQHDRRGIPRARPPPPSTGVRAFNQDPRAWPLGGERRETIAPVPSVAGDDQCHRRRRQRSNGDRVHLSRDLLDRKTDPSPRWRAQRQGGRRRRARQLDLHLHPGPRGSRDHPRSRWEAPPAGGEVVVAACKPVDEARRGEDQDGEVVEERRGNRRQPEPRVHALKSSVEAGSGQGGERQECHRNQGQEAVKVDEPQAVELALRRHREGGLPRHPRSAPHGVEDDVQRAVQPALHNAPPPRRSVKVDGLRESDASSRRLVRPRRSSSRREHQACCEVEASETGRGEPDRVQQDRRVRRGLFVAPQRGQGRPEERHRVDEREHPQGRALADARRRPLARIAEPVGPAEEQRGEGQRAQQEQLLPPPHLPLEGRRAGVGPELAEAEVGDAEHRRRLEGSQRRHASESRHGVLLGEPARRPTASQPGSA